MKRIVRQVGYLQRLNSLYDKNTDGNTDVKRIPQKKVVIVSFVLHIMAVDKKNSNKF
jgi:hypothetical protein